MAFLKGSRYATLGRFVGTEFQGVLPRPIEQATPVVEHTVSLKDRLDGLAYQYHREPRTWTRLSAANPDALFSEDLLWQPEPEDENGRERLGSVLLVPKREEEPR